MLFSASRTPCRLFVFVAMGFWLMALNWMLPIEDLMQLDVTSASRRAAVKV